MTVETEQPGRPLRTVQHDETDRIRVGRADRQRDLDAIGGLPQRRRLEEAEHFDELAGPGRAEISTPRVDGWIWTRIIVSVRAPEARRRSHGQLGDRPD